MCATGASELRLWDDLKRQMLPIPQPRRWHISCSSGRMKNGMLRSSATALVFASLSTAGEAFAAVEVRDPTAPVARPECRISSASSAWKVPLSAAGVPIRVVETDGAKLEATVTVSPEVSVALRADTTSTTPASDRILVFTNPTAGQVYKVGLGGTCRGGTGPVPTETTVEFVADAPAPTVLGTLSESPEGLTKLTLDPSFVPFEQLSEITFAFNGTDVEPYVVGRTSSSANTYGVRACVGGACDGMTSTANNSKTPATPLLLFPYGRLCPNGRQTGKVEVQLTAKAVVVGQEVQPEAARGSLHIDCARATESELGASSRGSSGCTVRAPSPAPTSSVALGALALFFLVRRRSGSPHR